MRGRAYDQRKLHPPNEDYPNRFAMNLTEGILRYRDRRQRPSPMVPGEAYAVMIELSPTGNPFSQGRRLRLDIASSNFPRFDINPIRGSPKAQWSIFVDAAHPSHIVLPVTPGGT